MEVNQFSRNKTHRLTSTIMTSKEDEQSPNYERQNTGSSWFANLESVTTPKMKNRHIVDDLDRLISLSQTQKVGSFPVMESRTFEQSRPLTDRIHKNELMQIQNNRNIQPVIKQQQSKIEKNKSCCNFFQRKVPAPIKVVQPPKILRSPPLNQLIVEKRRIKIVTPEQFNRKRLNTYNYQQKYLQTQTGTPSSPRHY